MSSADSLTGFIEEVTGDDHLRIEDDLGHGYVRLKSAEAERRQAKHDIRGSEDVIIEMLRNARDAHASSIFVAVSREGSTRRIVVVDNGQGVPDPLRERIFDARVTSKLDSMHVDTWGVHGRGMALYAIKVNAEKAFVAASMLEGGTSIVVETNTEVLPEKSDQSTQPSFSLTDSGTVVVRGPRNINRTVAEFAYIDRASCSVYYGSPVEVAATLWAYGRSSMSAAMRAFSNDTERVEVCKRIALASTPEEFADIAASLGLAVSPRSARRIMDGEIEPLAPVADSIDPYQQNATTASSRAEAEKRQARKSVSDGTKIKDARGLRIAPEHLEDFKQGVQDAFASLADAYYLEPHVGCEVLVRKDTIHVSIPIRRQL